MAEVARRLIGVSLKMYMGLARTRAWVGAVAALARDGGADGIELFVAPGYLSVVESAGLLAGTGVELGAQDVCAEDEGAFTGEVSARMLSEAGCRFVVVGHAERRRLYGETDRVVEQKVSAAVRAGLVPVICVGESAAGPARQAIEAGLAQIAAATEGVGSEAAIVVAWEPVWAIGAEAPAPPEFIAEVAAGLRAGLRARGPSRVLYGGSAGPGLLERLGGQVDGLFLGRFAHDPVRLGAVLAEARR